MKRIALLATGGTIAGQLDAEENGASNAYTAAVRTPQELLAALPPRDALAEIVPESIFAIDSKDITVEHWKILAQRIDALLADPSFDGIVVTHGTDTLEETAWFLHLSLPAGKPVVLTAAMRPADAPDADGPANLRQAIDVAVRGVTRDCGVVVVMANQIHAARTVAKRHTCARTAIVSPAIDTDGAPCNTPLGRADAPTLDPAACREATRDAGRFPLTSQPDTLPEVALIEVPGGASPIFLQVMTEGNPYPGRTEAKPRTAEASDPPRVAGVVLALPGNGSLPESWCAAVRAAEAQGTVVVRAARAGTGAVSASDKLPGIATGSLSPVKARITLMLAPSAESFSQVAAASATPPEIRDLK